MVRNKNKYAKNKCSLDWLALFHQKWEQVISCLHTLICYRHFETDFIFSINLYRYQVFFLFDFRELHSKQPVPFLPGDSINDSLLMNDLDENTQLRNAVAKLTRRVQDLEDNDKTRSYILYPTVLVLSLKLLYDVFIKSK